MAIPSNTSKYSIWFATWPEIHTIHMYCDWNPFVTLYYPLTIAGEQNRWYCFVYDLRTVFRLNLDRKPSAHQRVCSRMGVWWFRYGEHQLCQINVASWYSNLEFEAVSKEKNCNRCGWFDYFQKQISTLYGVNRSYHFLPNEVQFLSIG